MHVDSEICFWRQDYNTIGRHGCILRQAATCISVDMEMYK